MKRCARALPWPHLLLGLTLCACAQDGKIRTAQEPLPLTERGPGTVLKTVTLATEHKEATAVQCAPIKNLTAGPKLTLPATLVTSPSAIAHVGMPWPGRVVGVEADIGQQVREGQALLRIDTPEMHRGVQDFMQARAQAKRAADAWDRQEQRLASGQGGPQDLAAAEAVKAAAALAFSEAQEHLSDLGLSDNELSVLRAGGTVDPLHSTLRAPAAGQVEAIEVAMGQTLQGGETMMRILASGALWAVVNLPEQDVGQVRVGLPVTITPVGSPQSPRTGTISAISDTADATTHTHEVRVALTNGDNLLQPGMSGVATLQLGRQGGTHFLPTTAVQQLSGGPVAYRCNKDGTFAAVRVAVGEERSGVRNLVAGLRHTDAVVTVGAADLHAEMMRQEVEDS